MSVWSHQDTDVVVRLACFRYLSRSEIKAFLFDGSTLKPHSMEIQAGRILDRLRAAGLVASTQRLGGGPGGGSAGLSYFLTPDKRRALEKLRSQIRKVAPDATESISYGIPTFKVNGGRLVYFAAFAKHLSIYALSTETPEVRRYVTSKGTIQFQPDKPLPASLLTKLLKARLATLKKDSRY
ncbi:MAG: iron chaperone [Thermoleophilaceae bacterium]